MSVTVAGDNRGPMLSPLLPVTDSAERREQVCPVARIRRTAPDREQEENREANDSPDKRSWLFRQCKVFY